jgi:hypothetical protein
MASMWQIDVKMRELGILFWIGMISGGIGGFIMGSYLYTYIRGDEEIPGILLGVFLVILGLILAYFDIRRIYKTRK